MACTPAGQAAGGWRPHVGVAARPVTGGRGAAGAALFADSVGIGR